MTMMDTGDVQRLGYAMQAALHGGKRNGHRIVGGADERRRFAGDPQLEQLRYRLQDAFHDRLVHRVYDTVVDLLRDRTREVIRGCFASELRAAMIDSQPERGFDIGWIERRFADRLATTICERLATAIYDRASGPIGQRVVETVREAVTGTPFQTDERLCWRIREHLEPEITSRIASAVRERDGVSGLVERALRERFRDALQGALSWHGGSELDPERVIELTGDRLVGPIGDVVVGGLEDRLRGVIRERVAEVVRNELDDALRAVVRGAPDRWPGERREPVRYEPFRREPARREPFSFARGADTIARHVLEALLDSMGGVVRGVSSAIRRDGEAMMWDHLVGVIRETIAELRPYAQEPEHIVEQLRMAIAEVIRPRLVDMIRERVFDITREPLRHAIRNGMMASTGPTYADSAWSSY